MLIIIVDADHLVELAKPRGSRRGEDGGDVVGLLSLIIKIITKITIKTVNIKSIFSYR